MVPHCDGLKQRGLIRFGVFQPGFLQGAVFEDMPDMAAGAQQALGDQMLAMAAGWVRLSAKKGGFHHPGPGDEMINGLLISCNFFCVRPGFPGVRLFSS